MAKSYHLTQWLYPDKAARFFIDGKRVSRAQYEHICSTAERLDCFSTRAWPIEGGSFKRRNDSCATMSH
jgi:hypothetical protein